MGALKGSISVRRYVVLDKLPAEARKKLTKGLRAHAFVPVDPRGDAERSVGWVDLHDGENAELSPELLFWNGTDGEQLRVTLRIDVLKPPAAEVKRQTAVRVAEREKAEDRALARREKQAIKDEVARQLRLRTLPRVRLPDVVWNLDTGVLWLWSQAKGVNEAFLELFAKSCALKLDIDGPARWVRDAKLGRGLETLEPTPELWAGFPGVRPLGGATEVA